MGRSKNTTTDWWVLYLRDQQGQRHILTGSSNKLELYEKAQKEHPGYTEIRLVNKKTHEKNSKYFDIYDERMHI